MDTKANFSSFFDLCPLPGVTQRLFTSWFIMYLLFLPVFLLVLYIGFNKWRRPQSAAGGLSHSDVFTLHMVLMEMLGIVGSSVACYGFFTWSDYALVAARSIFNATFTGQMLFHSLTCVERYLAVVHPVSYLRLRREGGATIRNTCISVVWLLGIFFCAVLALLKLRLVLLAYCFVLILLAMTVITFCSLYVLRVLHRPKPGGGAVGGDRKQTGQSMRATVYTMMAILGVLLLKLLGLLVYNSLEFLSVVAVDRCVLPLSAIWLHLPSALVLPLLFLHRAGKLPGRCRP